jgi:hypothetical protein
VIFLFTRSGRRKIKRWETIFSIEINLKQNFQATLGAKSNLVMANEAAQVEEEKDVEEKRGQLYPTIFFYKG